MKERAKFFWKEKLSGQMDISHAALEMFLRKTIEKYIQNQG